MVSRWPAMFRTLPSMRGAHARAPMRGRITRRSAVPALPFAIVLRRHAALTAAFLLAVACRPNGLQEPGGNGRGGVSKKLAIQRAKAESGDPSPVLDILERELQS